MPCLYWVKGMFILSTEVSAEIKPTRLAVRPNELTPAGSE